MFYSNEFNIYTNYKVDIMSNLQLKGKPIKIILFHATWCSYCNDFLPIWKEMMSDKEAAKNIDFEEYEDMQINDLPDHIKLCNGVDVRASGYPAIKITVNDKEYMYTGRRIPERIYDFIMDVLKNPKEQELTGGANKIKRRITSDDFKIVFENTNLLKPFKYV